MATVLTFYKRAHLDVASMPKQWTPAKFEKKVTEALEKYEYEPDHDHPRFNDKVNAQLVEAYKTAISKPEPPSMGRFIPSNWTENAYLVEKIGEVEDVGSIGQGGKRKGKEVATEQAKKPRVM